MPAYTYTGDEGRYYPTLGLTPDPGGLYELAANPGDGRWTPPDPLPEPEPLSDPLPEPELAAALQPAATAATSGTAKKTTTAKGA